MKWNTPALWAPLLSLLLVVWFVWSGSQRVSPGPLAAAHAQAEAGIDEHNCETCHGDDPTDRADMAKACGECHTDVDLEIAQKRGLHGHLPGEAARCGACHSEHKGPKFQMVSQASFLRAGIGDAENFDHAGLDYRLGGRHLELECRQCHANCLVPVLGKGERRFMGQSQRCESCHKDPHEGRLHDCKSCHGEERPFREAPLYQHTERFPLAGAHSTATCVQCHEKAGPSSIEAVGEARERGQMVVRACVACHDSPHADGFMAAAIAELRVAREVSCERCHPLSSTTFRREGAEFPKEWHAFSGFALVAPHDKQECRECHADGLAYKGAHPGRPLENCGACHADVHEGQFGQRACRACHAYESWKPSLYGAAAHAQSTFPLEQSHATTRCDDCHLDVGGLRRFVGTPQECDACHGDAHPQRFAAAKSCRECHQADAFAAARNNFDHARWTGFAVDNAHERAGCESCHVRLAQPEPLTGRVFGRIEVHPPATVASCANCHGDPHEGFFASAKDCDECHGTQRFEVLAHPFDHSARTGFALVGSHLTRTCTICHVPRAEKDRNGRRFGSVAVDVAAAQAACTTCHTDVHAGTFEQPARGCLECHTQVAWTDGRGSFDHERWTGFALAGRHQQAGCEACHTPLPKVAAGGRRLARAPGARCDDCHVDPHVGQFEVAGTTACTRCHVAGTDFREPSFDHQRDSRFPLDATHRSVACAACHFSWPLAGGGKAVRYRPLGIICGDCHDTRR